MASRLKLHEEFCEILGSRNVYYQPPSSVTMKYDCIRYSLAGADHKRANNTIYKNTNRYEVIVITHDPDSDIGDKILAHFSMCSFDRSYVADNLNHKVYTLYY
jgi:hypothetical protein